MLLRQVLVFLQAWRLKSSFKFQDLRSMNLPHTRLDGKNIFKNKNTCNNSENKQANTLLFNYSFYQLYTTKPNNLADTNRAKTKLVFSEKRREKKPFEYSREAKSEHFCFYQTVRSLSKQQQQKKKNLKKWTITLEK